MYSRIYKFNSLAATTPQPINPSERTAIVGWYLYNSAAAARFVKLYWGNTTNFSSQKDVPTIGTDVPNVTIQIPATSAVTGNFHSPFTGIGTCFLSVTVNAIDTDNTAGSAGDVIGSMFYE